MTQRPNGSSSPDNSGSKIIGIVCHALALLGVSGYFFVTGINEIQSQDAVVTHKHAPSEHVTGDRAVNTGIKDIVLGGVTLVLGDSI